MRRLCVAASLALLGACASAPPAPEGVCHATRAAGADVPPEAWLSLLLHNYDPKTQHVIGAPLDCTGTPIAWQEADEQCAVRSETLLPPGPLTAGSVVAVPLEETTRLVWVPVQRFPDGDALGVLARVQVRADSLVVLAVGSARAGLDRTLLKLERLNDVDLAILEGDRCDGPVCQRFARLIPQRGRRFIAEPLRTPTGVCAGPASFAIKRQREQSLPSGLHRVFELESTLAFSPTQLLVHEQLFVKDRDPHQPPSQARLYRSAQDDRVVTATSDRLVVDKPSLWARLSEFSDAH